MDTSEQGSTGGTSGSAPSQLAAPAANPAPAASSPAAQPQNGPATVNDPCNNKGEETMCRSAVRHVQLFSRM